MKYSFVELREILGDTRSENKKLCLECLEHVQYNSLYTIKKYIERYKAGLCKTFDEFAERFSIDLISNSGRVACLSITEDEVNIIVDLIFSNEHLNQAYIQTILVLICLGLGFEEINAMLTVGNTHRMVQMGIDINRETTLRGEM